MAGLAEPTAPRKKPLETSQGLYNLAAQNGLQADADRLLKQQEGEKTKEIFSGGFISDSFDTLNALQYGVVGVLKGKTFLEGVKTRQSFSDQDALGDKGIPGMIAGIALDIAFDPLTYIAPATIVKKIPFATKLLKGAKEFAFGRTVTKTIQEGTEVAADVARTYDTMEGGSKLGRYLASKFSWNAQFGGDKIYQETWERGVKNIAVGVNNVLDIGRPVAKLSNATVNKAITTIAPEVEGGVARIRRLKDAELQKVFKGDDYAKIKAANETIDQMGREQVELGLLSKETFEKNFEEYITNSYLKYELPEKGKRVFPFSKFGIKGTKVRKAGLTQEAAEKAGQIKDAGYLYLKTMVQMKKDIETAKLLNELGAKWGANVAQEGFGQIPKTAKFGNLGSKYVPEHIADMVKELIEPPKWGVGKELVANFKFFKVIMNPATHARNIVSNKILNWWKLGMNPLDPRTIFSETESLAEIAKKGGKWTDEAKPLGYNLDTMWSQELRSHLDDPQLAGLKKSLGGKWASFKEFFGNIYQQEENQAKLSAYIFNRKYKNLSPEEAWKAAESATFNYAQVTPFVRKLRESLFGFPFITFGIKAVPVVAETAVKAPRRISVIGKIKQAIEQQSDIQETEAERESEPAWVKNGFYVKLPIKDQYGRSAYFDLTYILPFGDIMSGQFFERGQDIETGVKEGLVTTGIRKSPFINIASELAKNKDFYGNSIWKDSDSTDQQLKDIMRHLTKTYVPPPIADTLPGGYNREGERQYRGFKGATQADEENQKRTLMEELLRNVGAKIQPIDADIQETYAEWNKKRALRTLLRERGIINELEIPYIPKKKEED